MNLPFTAGELCTRTVVFAERTLPLNEAAKLMRVHHVGCLIVVDETAGGRVPVGLLTDRDIVTAVVASDIDPSMLRVEDMMSQNPVTVLEVDSLLDVLATMQRAGVRRVPVVDPRGILQGLLGLDDVIEIVCEQLDRLVQVLSSARRIEPVRRP